MGLQLNGHGGMERRRGDEGGRRERDKTGDERKMGVKDEEKKTGRRRRSGQRGESSLIGQRWMCERTLFIYAGAKWWDEGKGEIRFGAV